jgi:hypothetical protein
MWKFHHRPVLQDDHIYIYIYKTCLCLCISALMFDIHIYTHTVGTPARQKWNGIALYGFWILPHKLWRKRLFTCRSWGSKFACINLRFCAHPHTDIYIYIYIHMVFFVNIYAYIHTYILTLHYITLQYIHTYINKTMHNIAKHNITYIHTY